MATSLSYLKIGLLGGFDAVPSKSLAKRDDSNPDRTEFSVSGKRTSSEIWAKLGM